MPVACVWGPQGQTAGVKCILWGPRPRGHPSHIFCGMVESCCNDTETPSSTFVGHRDPASGPHPCLGEGVPPLLGLLSTFLSYPLCSDRENRDLFPGSLFPPSFLYSQQRTWVWLRRTTLGLGRTGTGVLQKARAF